MISEVLSHCDRRRRTFRTLQAEYDQLRQAHLDYASPAGSVRDSDAGDGSRDAEMIAEAKLLRQHKGRLESRMQILEDHNHQLEAQLQRLRLLLDQVTIKTYKRALDCLTYITAPG